MTQQAVEYYDSKEKMQLAEYFRTKQMKIYKNDKLMDVLEGKRVENPKRLSIFSIKTEGTLPLPTDDNVSEFYQPLDTDATCTSAKLEPNQISTLVDTYFKAFSAMDCQFEARIAQSVEIQRKKIENLALFSKDKKLSAQRLILSSQSKQTVYNAEEKQTGRFDCNADECGYSRRNERK